MNKKKVILSISAHDPTGGAGLQCDILTSNLYNHHCVSALTGQTVQTSKKLLKKIPSQKVIFKNNLEELNKNFKIDGIKIGVLWSAEIYKELIKFLKKIDIPIIIDPIISAGGGGNFLLDKEISDLKKHLYPLSKVITPNREELKKIGGYSSSKDSIKNLYESGIKNVYLTGRVYKNEIINYLYINGEKKIETKSQYINSKVHGTGCALSTSILCNLVNGKSIETACKKSHALLFKLVKNSIKTSGQNIINFKI